MKKELCAAFCEDISVTEVAAGLAVSTAFLRDDGDRVSFFVIDEEHGKVRLEDDGATVPYLEEAGVDFDTETRRRAFQEMLEFAGAEFDESASTIKTAPFDRSELGERSLAFVGLMIRMFDFLLLTQEKVTSTFREDAARKIRLEIGDRATIRENEAVSPELSETKADMVIESEGRPPVAVFFGDSQNRVHDAIFLYQAAAYEVKQPLLVIALLEDDQSVPKDLRNRASNRLTTVPVFRNDENAAVARIGREAISRSVH